MNRDIRHPPQNRYKLLATLFSFMIVNWILIAFIPTGEYAAFLLLLVISFILGLLGLAALIDYLITRVSIQNDKLHLTSLLSRGTININVLKEVRWRFWLPFGAMITARGLDGKITIDVFELSRADSLWLINLFYQAIPEEQHKGWGAFCWKYALRLRDGDEHAPKGFNRNQTTMNYENWRLEQIKIASDLWKKGEPLSLTEAN